MKPLMSPLFHISTVACSDATSAASSDPPGCDRPDDSVVTPDTTINRATARPAKFERMRI